MSATDVVVIGAGIGGLTAAAYLARVGLNVQVFEQHTVPGGYVSSFTREGFTFPAGPTSFGSNGIVFPILHELGLEHKRRFVPVWHQLSWDELDVPFFSPLQAREALCQAFPHETRGLHRFFRWAEIGGRGFRDMNASGLMFGGGKAMLSQTVRLGLRNPLYSWAMAVARGQTNHTLYTRFFRDAHLREMLGRLGYPVMTGQVTLGLWAAYFHDYIVPVGGMQSVTNVLVRYLRSHGAQLHLGQRVDRILVRDGATAGVRLADGAEVEARWVVSAADIRRTFLQLIGREHLQPTLIDKLARGVPSECIFVVFLGLDSSPDMAAGLCRFQASHVCYNCADGNCVQMALLSKDDPSVAPPGKHALWIGKFEQYEAWAALTEAAYRERKRAESQVLIGRAEAMIPGLSRHIEVLEAATPLTYERYTGNWHGATAGWNYNPTLNPQIDFSRDVDLRNFFCVGHWMHSPGGVPTAMITAWYIAREILKGWAVSPMPRGLGRQVPELEARSTITPR
jgi:prolycopene isomerase